jgi:hypothetical protein
VTSSRGARNIVEHHGKVDGMQTSALTKPLALAERHVLEGQQNLDRQRALVARIEHAGLPTADAEALLRQYEAMQSIYIAERDRLRQVIAKPGG